MKEKIYLILNNLKETEVFANKISKFLSKRSTICLFGKIGSGKTTFCRFLINSLSKKKIKVLSPTFPIVQIYQLNNLKIWHYDFYRLKKKEELTALDLDIARNDCLLVEWPEIAIDLLHDDRINITFDDGGADSSRNIKIEFYGKFIKLRKKICKNLKI